jgi:signal-transduction protein with cAMP-binding, CBS, and nucleotidyltransferase domain
MPLNFSIINSFIAEYAPLMQDKTLLRTERYHILAKLRETLWHSLRDSEQFESELSEVIESISRTDDYRQLQQHHLKSVAGIRNYFNEEQSIVDVHDLFRIIRDALTVRTLRLVEREMEADGFGPVPAKYCWIGLGSEGRDEQTFITDQDNMLIYEDNEGEITGDLRGRFREQGRQAGVSNGRQAASTTDLLKHYYEQFSNRVVNRLHDVGFEKCKGGIMPSNEKWRGSVRDWKSRIQDTLSQAKGNLELLDLIILTDARVIDGETTLYKIVLDEFFTLLKQNNHIMKSITESSVMMPTALGFFGKFKVEPAGENIGKFNIKLLGWSPLIMSVRALALHRRLYETNTLRRIKELRKMNMIKKEMGEELIDAYLLFVRFRIMNQLDTPGSGNYVNPEMLGNEEAVKLRKAMRSVEAFQKYIHEIILFGQPF